MRHSVSILQTQTSQHIQAFMCEIVVEMKKNFASEKGIE